MEKQKICIVGGGLTGLITAITLSKLNNISIDLVSNFNNKANIKSIRTTAVSQNNYDFLKKLNVVEYSKRQFWPCQEMKLYVQSDGEHFLEIFDIKKEEKNKKIFYMIENNILIKNMLKEINNCKTIKLTTQKKVSEISTSGFLRSIKFDETKNLNYNLIILCTGNNSNLTNTVFNNQSYGRSYEETSITTLINHDYCINNIAKQIFLDNSILALLPISNTKTSIVWTMKRNEINKPKRTLNSFIKKKIRKYTKDFYNNIKFVEKLEFKDVNFLIKKEYFKNRVLLFGEGLHQVHPLAGQGFNMILRDLMCLEKILKDNINLGLDIGNDDVLSEFSFKTKPRNFAYSMGIDLLKNSFSFKNKKISKVRNNVISGLNKSNFVKEVFYNLANEGFKF